MKLLDYLPEIVNQIQEQLESDERRWGSTWKHRPQAGQEERTRARLTDYFDQHRYAGTKVPWLKIIGECIICLVREQHPEESE